MKVTYSVEDAKKAVEFMATRNIGYTTTAELLTCQLLIDLIELTAKLIPSRDGDRKVE